MTQLADPIRAGDVPMYPNEQAEYKAYLTMAEYALCRAAGVAYKAAKARSLTLGSTANHPHVRELVKLERTAYNLRTGVDEP